MEGARRTRKYVRGTPRWPVVTLRPVLAERSSEQAGYGTEAGVSFVIPAFNEAESVGRVVRAAAREFERLDVPNEIIVVDDASIDHTADEARAAGARVLVHPYNRGYGNSLKTGINAARFERVVICDADGSYPVEQLGRLLHNAHEYDMVVGARTGQQFYGSAMKRLGRWFQLALVNYVTGTKVPDANSGFRLIRRSLALRYFDFVCTGFSFTTSITIALICEQYAVRFVNIDYARRQGRSHVRYFRDTLRSLQIITHCILRYNPLKAFLLLALLPFLLSAAPLIVGGITPAAIAGAAGCICTSLLIFGMGMLAYCVGGGASVGKERGVDAGVYAWVDRAMETTPKLRQSEPRSELVSRKAA